MGNNYVDLYRYRAIGDSLEDWVGKPIVAKDGPRTLELGERNTLDLRDYGYTVDETFEGRGPVERVVKYSYWGDEAHGPAYILEIEASGQGALYYCADIHDLFGLLAKFGPLIGDREEETD